MEKKNQKFVSFPFSVLTLRSSFQRTIEIAIVLFQPVKSKEEEEEKEETFHRYNANYYFLDYFNRW